MPAQRRTSVQNPITLPGQARQAPRPSPQAAAAPDAGFAPDDARDMQESIGNQAVADLVSQMTSSGSKDEAPTELFDQATSGAAQKVPFLEDMEASFGQDFSDVEAHVGEKQEMSKMGARAAAMGDHVAFADTKPDRKTVAHELAHVVQQRNVDQNVARLSEVSSPSDEAEREANAVAAAVTSGEQVDAGSLSLVASGTVHRWFGEGEEETSDVASQDASGQANDAGTDGSYLGGEHDQAAGDEAPAQDAQAGEGSSEESGEESSQGGGAEDEVPSEDASSGGGSESESGEESSEEGGESQDVEEEPSCVDQRPDLLPQLDVVDHDIDIVSNGIVVLQSLAKEKAGKFVDPRVENLIAHKRSAALESGSLHAALTRELEPDETPDMGTLKERLDALDADVTDLVAEYQLFEPYVEERKESERNSAADEVRRVAAAVESLAPEVQGAQYNLSQEQGRLAYLGELLSGEIAMSRFKLVMSGVDFLLGLEPTGVVSLGLTMLNMAVSDDGPSAVDVAGAGTDVAGVADGLSRVVSKSKEVLSNANKVAGLCTDLVSLYGTVTDIKEKVEAAQQKVANQAGVVQAATQKLGDLMDQVATKVAIAQAACQRSRAKKDAEEEVEVF
jgi:hypothetical protein